MTEGPFKHRYNGHASSFRLERYRSATKQSEKVWTLWDRGIDFHIDWSIIRWGTPYKVGRTTCDLCTSEKLEIVKRASDPGLLNNRTEILAKCRHNQKFLTWAFKCDYNVSSVILVVFIYLRTCCYVNLCCEGANWDLCQNYELLFRFLPVYPIVTDEVY